MIFIGYLRWGHVARSYVSALFDPYLNSVIIGRVHTSSEDVEAGFNYPLLKKVQYSVCARSNPLSLRWHCHLPKQKKSQDQFNTC
jgi:hypothetical protein